MSALLPPQLDPWRAVKLGAAFAGSATLAELPRLAAAVLGADGPASYALRFERDETRQAVALGQVAMALRLRCQRCLGEVVYAVEAPIALALVRARSDADALGLAPAVEVAEHLDALPLGEDPIHPLDLIEDELLLALPLVPLHAVGECQPAVPLDLAESAQADGAAAPKNPFAVLATLKSKG